MTPVKEVDTTLQIWEYYFKVRMPYLQSRSLEDIKRHGVTLSGVKELDADISKQMITTMLTISKMVEYYQEGVPIYVVLESDVKLIYQYICEHIHAWKSRLERGVNIGDAPIDDLIAMDQFANVVYKEAKYQFTPDVVNSFLIQQMVGVQRFNASAAIANLNKPTVVNNGVTTINGDDADTHPERDSLTEFFKNRLINLNRRY